MDIRVGIIGFGYWGPNLVRNLVATEGVDVVYCAEQRHDRRELAARQYPALKVIEEADRIFDDAEIDAIVVATPVTTHYQLAKRALEAGKHVLVSKPMARSVAEAEELVELADQQRPRAHGRPHLRLHGRRPPDEGAARRRRVRRPLLLRLGPREPRHLPARHRRHLGPRAPRPLDPRLISCRRRPSPYRPSAPTMSGADSPTWPTSPSTTTTDSWRTPTSTGCHL